MPKYVDGRLVLDKTLFIMSPPRSGSTLFRNMLNGHPKLYSPPEFYLLSFDTMKQRAMAYKSKKKQYLKKGLIQTFAELYEMSYQDAEVMTKSLEDQDASTIEAYALIQAQIGDRLLIDKTPSNVGHLSNLLMAIERFDKPVFFHLHRHPYSAVDSHLRQTSVQHQADNETFGQVRHRKTQLQAEQTWINCHMHALALQDLVPKNRYIRVCYEKLVENPEHEMRKICKKLNLRFSRGMLNPYKDADKTRETLRKHKGKKTRVEHFPLGDPGFYGHKDIDKKTAEKWRHICLPQPLSEPTTLLAQTMGYELPEFEEEYRYLVGF